MSEWQQIGQIPIDTGRLALVDPMNLADVERHEDELLEILDQNPETDRPMAYEAVVNEHDVAVAVVLATGLGDGVYPVEARFEQAAGTTRIGEVRVRFLPHPRLGYELPE